jgi:hypothetical protein
MGGACSWGVFGQKAGEEREEGCWRDAMKTAWNVASVTGSENRRGELPQRRREREEKKTSEGVEETIGSSRSARGGLWRGSVESPRTLGSEGGEGVGEARMRAHDGENDRRDNRQQ